MLVRKGKVTVKEQHYHGHRKRLRERFLIAGLPGFQDYEVLELLLTFAIPRQDVKPMAKALLKTFGSLRQVFDSSVEELQEVPGVGANAAVLIRFLKDAGTLYLKEKIHKLPVLNSPTQLIDYCRHALAGQRNELFQVVYLNAQNEVIDVGTVAEGTVDHTAVYARKIVEGALRHNAVGLVLVHNHPGGAAAASEADRWLTDSLAQAAKPVGISIYDHIIIGQDGHFSFREHGLL